MSLNIFSLLNNNFQLTNIALNFIEEDLTYNMFENTQELYENLEYFKRNYFEQATLSTHMDYVYKIYKFRKNNQGQFPTKKQFLLSFRNTCFCRYYVNDDDMFVLAAEFFLSKFILFECILFYRVFYYREKMSRKY